MSQRLVDDVEQNDGQMEPNGGVVEMGKGKKERKLGGLSVCGRKTPGNGSSESILVFAPYSSICNLFSLLCRIRC